MTNNLEDVHMAVITRPRAARVVSVEPTVKRVRAMLGGQTVVDSRRTLILFEKGHLPVYYFPLDDVRRDLLAETERHTTCPRKGEATYYTVRGGDRVAENAAWRYPEPIDDCPDISGHVALYWNAMDSWWEEDDQVFKHARDPYHRVDVLRSSRYVTVHVGDEVVADTARPLLLLETRLPPRWYVPRADVRMDRMTPTDTTTTCPYKRAASYFSVGEHEDIAWSYLAPIPECPKIEQAVCFFSERDGVTVTVDGEAQERPETHWKHGLQDG